jgi:DNA-binding transcriptional MocR family regulator
MLNVKVHKDDPTDLYEQVAAEIRRTIANGEAQPGERLPPAKDLAAILEVNTNTVLRALRLGPRQASNPAWRSCTRTVPLPSISAFCRSASTSPSSGRP